MARPLSDRERRIFTAVAETVAGAAAGPGVADAIDPFVRRMPASDRRLLGALLAGLEYAAPAALARLRRFSDLDPARREAWLRSWAASAVPLRRQGAAALRALGALAYYGREEAWADVGYDGPWLGRVDIPVHDAPALRAPDPGPAGPRPGVTSARELPAGTRLSAKVCVVGTGAGGAAALARLAEAGVDVVAVEAGGLFTAADATQRELEMLPRLFREAGLRTTADRGIGILQGSGVGGSTLHNTGLVWDPPAGILDRWRAEHHFPYDDDALAPLLRHVRETLEARPIPESGINANNGAIRRGAAALGWRYRVADHNRDVCSGCGYCVLGCAYNRKKNASLTWVPRAVAAGARVVCDAPAVRLEGRAGERRVICDRVGPGGGDGGELVVEAEVVVVAAGALDTPALLLRSGLGNDRVGRGLRLHPSALVQAEMPAEIRAWRGLPQSVVVDEFADFETDGRGGFLFIALALWPGTMAASTSGLGVAHRSIMRRFPDLASCGVLLHDETEGRVTTARDGRPVARYKPEARDRAELRRGVRALARLFLAAGARTVHLPYDDAPPVTDEAALDDALARARDGVHRIPLGSVHPQGSCPLGGRRSDAACDPEGRLWGEPDVYVADTSLFPGSVGVPPQVTTMALGLAVADRILERIGPEAAA
ncbi:MAG TPA: GMC family oxidoreductase N-terminal domain-containing protein [Longimicrobiales bacterium]|nr:GMC family oxidoreductase N-terminal domain-containing protein [Longimicrobiales bacterium]